MTRTLAKGKPVGMPAENPALQMMRKLTDERREAIRNAKPRESGAYTDPLNPYTGEVSLMAIMENIRNGHTGFPVGLGNTVKPGQSGSPESWQIL